MASIDEFVGADQPRIEVGLLQILNAVLRGSAIERHEPAFRADQHFVTLQAPVIHQAAQGGGDGSFAPLESIVDGRMADRPPDFRGTVAGLRVTGIGFVISSTEVGANPERGQHQIACGPKVAFGAGIVKPFPVALRALSGGVLEHALHPGVAALRAQETPRPHSPFPAPGSPG